MSGVTNLLPSLEERRMNRVPRGSGQPGSLTDPTLGWEWVVLVGPPRPPHTNPPPTQRRVNSAPRCSGHAGGMTGPALFQGGES